MTASFAMYRMADSQFERGLRRQQESIVNRQAPRNLLLNELDRLRTQYQNEARAGLLRGLLLFNLSVLIGGAYLSYVSAKFTLRPIKEAMEAQSRFTADASHELRTPLSAMKSEIEVTLRSKNLSTAEAKEVLKSNLEEVNNLEQLTSGLLTLARAPEQNIKLTKTDLANVFSSVKRQSIKSAKNKQIKLRIEKPVSIFVVAHEPTLVSLILILVDNAIKYSEPTKIIDVGFVSSKDITQIFVKDQGVGIRLADQQKIFQRFYRADASRTKSKQVGGYGLGLAIAQTIATQHHTKILLDSEYKKGSEFSFVLKNWSKDDKI